MPITDRQLERRKSYLGGSDLAAIVGVDCYRNAADVYCEKVLGAVQQSNEAMDDGNILEPAILDWAERRVGKITRVGTERRIPDSPILVHLDAKVAASGHPVEAKSAGIRNPFFASNDEWGEEGTDCVPERILVQTHAQMAATETGIANVAALLGGRGFVMYQINFDAELWAHILSKVQAFWVDHVIARVPPADLLPSLETIKRIRRVPGSVMDVSEEFDAAWRARELMSDDLEVAETRFKECDRVVKSMLADNEAAQLSDGRMVTYMKQQRKGFTVEPTEYRVMRCKKIPTEKGK